MGYFSLDVQRRAQAEIDAIMGNDRLPTIKDRESLQYVNGLVTELLRWHNVGSSFSPTICVRTENFITLFRWRR